jgi:hypothetical protein
MDFSFPDYADLGETGAGTATGIAGNLTQDYGSIFRGGLPAIQEALKKSLTAGYETNLPAMTGGGALRLESLEPDLKKLIVDEKSTTLFNDLLATKRPAESTIEQYTTVDSIGEAQTYLEADAPDEIDSGLSRHTIPVKYIGAVGKVSNVAAAVKTQVDPVTLVKRLNNLAIKVKANKVAFNGNATNIPTEFDGLYASVAKSAYAADNIFDLKGHRPQIEDFNNAINAMSQQKGYVTSNVRAYLAPTAKKNYKAELLANKRYIVGGVPSVKAEEAAAAYDSFKQNMIAYDEGEMPMRKDLFLEPRFTPGNSTIYPLLDSTGASFVSIGSKAPGIPTITSITPVSDATSTLPGAVSYKYAVRSVNKYGHKSAAVESTEVAIADGENATFVIAPYGDTAANTATAYEIYRQLWVGATKAGYQYLFTVAVGSAIVDRNAFMPNTSNIYVVDFDVDEVLQYAQLLDFALFPLATSVDAFTWLQRLYGVLMVYNPQRIAILKNAGSLANS